MITSYLYARNVHDRSKLAADIDKLSALRNGIAHYRFEDPPSMPSRA